MIYYWAVYCYYRVPLEYGYVNPKMLRQPARIFIRSIIARYISLYFIY